MRFFLPLLLTLVISNVTLAEDKMISGQSAETSMTSIYSVHTVGQNFNKDITAKFVVLYSGQSTDFSPLYNVHFTYFDGDEMLNLSANFPLGNFYSVWNPVRMEAGVYRINALRYTDDAPWMQAVTVTVDTRPMVAKFNKIKSKTGDFEGGEISSQLQVKVTYRAN